MRNPPKTCLASAAILSLYWKKYAAVTRMIHPAAANLMILSDSRAMCRILYIAGAKTNMLR